MFHKPTILTAHPIQYRVVEFFLEPLLTFDLSLQNVFDSEKFDVVLRLENERPVHGFWQTGYLRQELMIDNVETETWVATGVNGIYVRFVPQHTGIHKGDLDVMLQGRIQASYPIEFVVHSGLAFSHLATIDPDNRRTFLVNGKTYLPLGQNLCWPRHPHTAIAEYRHWLDQIAANGGNFVRIWLTTRSFSLVGGSFDDYQSKMVEMAKLEAVLNECSERNIHVMLCTLQHGMFSRKVNPAWDYNPWNTKNGGHLSDPWLFFTDPLAKKQYLRMLTYYIRRFAHFDYLFAWELWNEVDWTDEFNHSAVTAWHREMSQFIHDSDPSSHLVTTSYKSYFGEAGTLDSIDFVNPHSYDYVQCNTLSMMISTQASVRSRYNKPVLHSEIGLDWRSGHGTIASDPQGICFLQGLLGLFAGGAGGAMQWWWDTYVEELGLYKWYAGIAEIAKQIDLKGPLLKYHNQIAVEPNASLSACGYTNGASAAFLVFAKEWQYTKPDIETISGVHVGLPMQNGIYHAEVRETTAGNEVFSFDVTAKDGFVQLDIPSLHNAAVVLLKLASEKKVEQ